ncbi:hypothetical protein J2857_002866 [Neorhizobium galegae]|uniref:cupin-like domain-containing protein n=1 Tax=Neorhizobium galegae TaxID=399 RepID=UPI001AE90101|nr:cupin-like domain-containing protein [Neorhizobium galegae]MBP2560097.1 hypothetical protein [Neorhizobium galegae]
MKLQLQLSNHSLVEAPIPGENEAPAPSIEHFPLFYSSVSCVCTLEPGDYVTIPDGWWHWVFSSDSSLSVNLRSQAKAADKASAISSISKLSEAETYELRELAFRVSERTPIALAAASAVGLFKPVTGLQSNIHNRWRIPAKDVYELTGYHAENPDYSLFALQPLAPLMGRQIIERLQIREAFLEGNIWRTYGLSDTGLHVDSDDSTVLQLMGKKRIFMFPPRMEQYLYRAKQDLFF